MVSPTMPTKSERSDVSPKTLEAAARAAIELRAGRTFTEAEWTAARAKLLEFAGILRGWDRKTPAAKGVMLSCYASENLKRDANFKR